MQLDVTSPPFDVIHSWWIPALGGKIDAIPGRVNHTWFQAQRAGTFTGQCAELCGLNHARMLARVEAMPRATFDAWLADRKAQQDAGTSELGREVYDGACAKCHGLAGEGKVAVNAPQLKGSSLRRRRRRHRAAVAQRQILMPAVGRDWNDTQMQATTDYLKERFASGS